MGRVSEAQLRLRSLYSQSIDETQVMWTSEMKTLQSICLSLPREQVNWSKRFQQCQVTTSHSEIWKQQVLKQRSYRKPRSQNQNQSIKSQSHEEVKTETMYQLRKFCRLRTNSRATFICQTPTIFSIPPLFLLRILDPQSNLAFWTNPKLLWLLELKMLSRSGCSPWDKWHWRPIITIASRDHRKQKGGQSKSPQFL